MTSQKLVRCVACGKSIPSEDPFRELLNKPCPSCGQLIKAATSCVSCDIYILSQLPLNELVNNPCPFCGGSVAHSINLTVDMIHVGLKTKVKDPKLSRPTVETVGGESYSHKLKRWVKIRRIIDRLRNWYSETVTDPSSGEVIHRTEEPLSKHLGHGSAKKK